MHRSLDDKLSSVSALCRKHCVKALYAFGSATRDDFDLHRSDVDLVVEFLPQRRSGLDDVYFRFLADLETLFGREVDLLERHVIERSENFIRRQAILSNLEPLYAAA